MDRALSTGPGKICFAIAVRDGFPPRLGGLAVAAHRICHYLADAGFEVHVVTYGEDGGSATRALEDGLTVHRVPVGETIFTRIFNLQHYLRKLDTEVNFDLFHGFFLSSVPPCMSLARASRNRTARPVIASVRGSDLTTYLTHPYTRPLLLSALREPNCWVTSVNQVYLDEVATEVDITGRSSVVRNGAPKLARTWQLTDENFGVVGSSGQFRKVKDVPLLVRAFRAMKPHLRRRLLLVGAFTDPLEQAWSKTLWQEGGVEDAVEVTGFLPHAQAVGQLARMHVYIQASAFEGLPNALLEAAAAGVPIVATAVGGVKEIFTDGKDALLVPHAAPNALTHAIERVIEDRQLAVSLADNAAKLCDIYSGERERAAWVNLHQQLIDSAPETIASSETELNAAGAGPS
jgi:L-malate glycosyltransferase